MAPARALHVAPPLIVIVERDGPRRRREHDRARDQVLWRRARKLRRRRRALGDGDVAGGFDELCELLVGDLGRVHPEAVDVDTMHRQRVAGHARQRAERLAFNMTAHRELAAGNPHHPVGRRTRCGDRIGDGGRECRGARRGTGLGRGDRSRSSVAGSQRVHGQADPGRNHHEPEEEPATTDPRRRPDGDSARVLFSFHRRWW